MKVWSGKKTQQINPDWDTVEQKFWKIWREADLQKKKKKCPKFVFLSEKHTKVWLRLQF